MSAGVWFWLLYVICVIFGMWAEWPADGRYRPLGGRLVVFILLGLLGFRVFGSPIQ
jgi:predicted membrane channel-forming protein YqfA (hemolysin III family)